MRLEVSTDRGETWEEFARSDIPTDNEFSSGWLAGSADVSDRKSRQAWVRFRMYAGGSPTGVIDARLYGVYRTPPPGAVTLEYGWREGGELKTHTVKIPAVALKETFMVPTGSKITDEFVRISAR